MTSKTNYNVRSKTIAINRKQFIVNIIANIDDFVKIPFEITSTVNIVNSFYALKSGTKYISFSLDESSKLIHRTSNELDFSIAIDTSTKVGKEISQLVKITQI